MREFTIDMPDEVLADLRARVAATRWPEELAGPGWAYGTDLGELRELLDYWRSGYEWRRHERRLNALSHHQVELDGLDIHFVWERGIGPAPLPLVLSHGWPSSFLEFEKLLPLLIHPDDPADAFDVVVPSLPGYGFSSKPRSPGFGLSWRTAELWARLMRDHLGYRRFGAAGGDIGASVTARLGMHHGDSVVGIHLNPDALWHPDGDAGAELSVAERAYLEGVARWSVEEGGYDHLQGTKPRTLAFGLNDSPAGLAAYIVEKFRAWSDCDGEVLRRFTMDELLTTVTLYWATGTIGSSFLPYFEHRHPVPGERGRDRVRVEVPVAVAVWPGDPDSQPPRAYAERGFDVRHWTVMPRGGHFAALEEPELLAQDLRDFFRPLREPAHRQQAR